MVCGVDMWQLRLWLCILELRLRTEFLLHFISASFVYFTSFFEGKGSVNDQSSRQQSQPNFKYKYNKLKPSTRLDPDAHDTDIEAIHSFVLNSPFFQSFLHPNIPP
jgi:hypothetical protein